MQVKITYSFASYINFYDLIIHDLYNSREKEIPSRGRRLLEQITGRSALHTLPDAMFGNFPWAATQGFTLKLP